MAANPWEIVHEEPASQASQGDPWAVVTEKPAGKGFGLQAPKAKLDYSAWQPVKEEPATAEDYARIKNSGVLDIQGIGLPASAANAPHEKPKRHVGLGESFKRGAESAGFRARAAIDWATGQTFVRGFDAAYRALTGKDSGALEWWHKHQVETPLAKAHAADIKPNEEQSLAGQVVGAAAAMGVDLAPAMLTGGAAGALRAAPMVARFAAANGFSIPQSIERYLDLRDQGVDESTAAKAAAVAYPLNTALGMLPMSVPGTAATRAATGAGIGGAAGIIGRAAQNAALGDQYEQMQTPARSPKAIVVDSVLGGIFGLAGPRGRAASTGEPVSLGDEFYANPTGRPQLENHVTEAGQRPNRDNPRKPAGGAQPAKPQTAEQAGFAATVKPGDKVRVTLLPKAGDLTVTDVRKDTVWAVTEDGQRRQIGKALLRPPEALPEDAPAPPATEHTMPEPPATLKAQMKAFRQGRKPGVLFTQGEPVPTQLPKGAKTAEIPGRGTLVYRDDATLEAARNGRMGEALGYGVDEKPAATTEVVTARDASGVPIQDVAVTPETQAEVTAAAERVAGPEGAVEKRPITAALKERQARAQASSAKPTLATSGEELFERLRQMSGGVPDPTGKLGMLYPAVRIPGWGLFRVSHDGTVSKLTESGIGEQVLNKREQDEFHHELSEDRAQVVLPTRPGHGSSYKRLRDVRVLHEPSGLAYNRAPGTRRMSGEKVPELELATGPDGTTTPTADGQAQEAAASPPKRRSRTTKKRTAGQQRTEAFLGATVGDTVIPSGDIGYSKAGNRYQITHIGKDGSVAVENLDTGSGTTWSRAEQMVAQRNGVAFKKKVKPETAEPQFDLTTRRDGTLHVTGDKDAIRAAMKAAGIDAKGIPSRTGILFGRSQAQRVRAALQGPAAPQDSAASFSRKESAASSRAPWHDLPDAVIIRPTKSIQLKRDYRAAKDGDTDAAYRLIRDTITDSDLAKIKNLVGDRKPIVVAVHAEEQVSVNKIPTAYAHYIAGKLGYSADSSIVQAQKIGRGSSDGFYRLANSPEFKGDVEPGRDYLIVDDTLTQGGTIAALKGYIEARGGHVIGASALMGKQYSAKLAPSEEILRTVRERYGQDFDQWWQQHFGYGLDHLTESELRYLANVKVPPTEPVRDRILAARQARDTASPGRTGGSGSGEPPALKRGTPQDTRPSAGFFVPPTEQIKAHAAKLMRDWAKRPTVEVVRSEADLPKPIRDQIDAADAHGEIKGVYWRGKVYLVAENVAGIKDAETVIFHEILGHHGLRELLGDDLDPVLNRVWLAYGRKGLQDIIDRYYPGGDFDLNNLNHRRTVAEEKLAHMAQTGEKPSILSRLYALIRRWLRRMGFKILPGNSEIQAVLARARAHVERGERPSERFLERSGLKERTAKEGGEEAKVPSFQRGGVPDAQLAREMEAMPEVRDSQGRLLAPNGRPSNLNERQWKQVRTDRFKQWFGDWEAVAKRNRLRQMRPVDVGDNAIMAAETLPEARRIARERYREIQRQTASSPIATTDGRRVRFGGSGFRETASHAADRRVLAVIPRLPELLQKAVPIRSAEPTGTADANVKAFHYYAAKARFPQGDAYVRMVIREEVNGNFYYDNDATSVERIEKAPNDLSPLPRSQSGSDATASEPTHSLAEWWHSVNPDAVSKVVDENGEPLVVYHGTAADFDAFAKPMAKDTEGRRRGLGWGKGKFYFARTGEAASSSAQFAQMTGRGDSPNVVPVFLSVKKPIAADAYMERVAAQQANGKTRDQAIAAVDKQIRADGFDGIMDEVSGGVAVFEPSQAKSATANRGTFNADDDIRFMRGKRHDDATEAALEKAGLGRRHPLRNVLDALKSVDREALDRAKATMVQGGLDRFHGLKRAESRIAGALPAEQSAYVAARFSTGSGTTMAAVLTHGAPEWRDGVVSKKPGSKGLLEALAPAKGELREWLGWMVGRRAARLAEEGRENLFNEDEIKALKRLGDGKQAKFLKVARDYNQAKKAVLDLAEQAGLIDAKTRPAWDSGDYIPFYRLGQDDQARGPRPVGGLSGQKSGIRVLKGGTAGLNDPLENIVLNFMHLIDASMKNHAIRQAADLLEPHGLMERVSPQLKPELIPMSEVRRVLEEQGVDTSMIDPAALQGIQKMMSFKPPTDPDVVRVMREGRPVYYRVHDPLLLRALTAVNDSALGGVMRPFRFFSRVLTGSVTSLPGFQYRNFARDALEAWVNSEGRFIPVWGGMKGWVASYREDKDFVDMMFAGGSFAGGYVGTNDPKRAARLMRRALRAKGFSTKRQDAFMATVTDNPTRAWDMYRRLTESAENANREAVYKAMLKQGESRARAGLEARDTLDFAMHGDWIAIQVLRDMIPFLNARLQGLYKMARAGTIPGKGMRARAAMRGGTIALASLALWWKNKDDPRYQGLQWWDKALFWHVWIGDHHFRIPKPFEIGFLYGTVPEIWANHIYHNTSDREAFSHFMWGMTQALAFNPIPQAALPAIEDIANYSFFTGRGIETESDQRRLPAERYNAHTSDTLVALGRYISNPLHISPKKMQHLVRGYTGGLGMYILAGTDMVTRWVEGAPAEPKWRVDQVPVLKSFVRGDKTPPYTQWTEDLYRLRDLANQVHGSINKLKKEGGEGDIERAEQYAEEYQAELAARPALDRAGRQLADIRHQIQRIENSPVLSPEAKRKQIDELYRERAALSREVMDAMRPLLRDE